MGISTILLFIIHQPDLLELYEKKYKNKKNANVASYCITHTFIMDEVYYTKIDKV